MKISFWERDGRKNDSNFKETMGSFSVICSIFEKGLRELGHYTDNIDEADFVGIADSLATDFYIPNKKCFGIYFVDCINTIPQITLQRIEQNPNLKLFSINKHTSNLFKKYGIQCDVLGAGIDNDIWHQLNRKNDIFTFIHSGFSNIRSGLDQLLEAWDLAFKGNKDVKLIIKDTSNSQILIKKIHEYQKSNNIQYINQRMNLIDIIHLYSSSHVLCSVFRHSGHGLPIGEASMVNCLPLVGDFEPSNEIVDDSFGVLLKPFKTVEMNKIKGNLINNWGLTDTFGSLAFPCEPLVYSYDIEEYAHILKKIYEKHRFYTNIRENALKIWDYKKSTKKLVEILEKV